VKLTTENSLRLLDEEALKDTQFMSAQEKSRVLKQWANFLKYGCQKKHFTDALYHHLTQHCEFIAHYDKNCFYDTYFDRGDDTAHFLTQFDNRAGVPKSIEYGMYGWYTSEDYHGINSAMCNIAVKYIDALTTEANPNKKSMTWSWQDYCLLSMVATLGK
jgi:hypothetical protein